MSSTDFRMPIPKVGDTVLFSTDYRTFSNPTVGWVIQEPGDSTISILTFTPTGYALVKNSVHHKDDPALQGDHGWHDLGCWDWAPITKIMNELTSTPAKSEKGESKHVRETAVK